METTTTVPPTPEAFRHLAFPVALKSLPHPVDILRTIPDRMAVVRMDTGDVLNIVSKKYPLVSHTDVFGALDEAIGQVGIPVLSRSVKAAYRGGYAKVIWTLDREINIDDHGLEDRVRMTLHARNSYNYSSLVALELGAFRIICSNGIVVGKMLARAQKRHVPSIKVPDLLKQITTVLEQTELVRRRWSDWNQLEYPRERFQQWLARRPIPKRGRQEILDYYTAQPDRMAEGFEPRFSGWEAFNALTWFATHRVTSRRADTLLLAEERVLDLAQVFSREELESSASRRTN